LSRPLKLRTFRIGTAAKKVEGLRIGAARYAPRGVPRSQRGSYFDVWLPLLAPSAALIRRFRRGTDDAAAVRRFFRAYEREMSRPEPRQAIRLLAELARRIPIAVGCYCEDESRCHRSRLKLLIERAGEEAN
jgi:uncharacterized protein YeaO (DUF488 family)